MMSHIYSGITMVVFSVFLSLQWFNSSIGFDNSVDLGGGFVAFSSDSENENSLSFKM